MLILNIIVWHFLYNIPIRRIVDFVFESPSVGSTIYVVSNVVVMLLCLAMMVENGARRPMNMLRVGGRTEIVVVGLSVDLAIWCLLWRVVNNNLVDDYLNFLWVANKRIFGQSPAASLINYAPLLFRKEIRVRGRERGKGAR